MAKAYEDEEGNFYIVEEGGAARGPLVYLSPAGTTDVFGVPRERTKAYLRRIEQLKK
jgi:hypothetical protein